MLSEIKADCEKIGLHVEHKIVVKFTKLIEEHIKWNEVFNISAHKSSQAVRIYQLIDSLTIHNYIRAGSCLDVGTGPGFPGLPLAILLPNTEFILLDSNKKKLAFAQHMISKLNLKNIRIEHTRIEKFQISYPINQIISRAFSDLNGILNVAESILDINGRILAMKGPQIENEIRRAKTRRPSLTVTVNKLPHVVDEQRILAVVEFK